MRRHEYLDVEKVTRVGPEPETLAPQTNPGGTLDTLALTTVNPAGTSKTRYPIISLPSLTVATMLVAVPCVIEVGARVSVQGFAAWAAAGLIVFRHRSNVARIVGGTERRLGARA